MDTSKATDGADDLADAVSEAGGRAGARARKAGADVGAAVDDASSAGANRIRRGARKSVDAYDSTVEEFGGQVGSLEETIRRNPLAAAGAALLVGVVLGRFIL